MEILSPSKMKGKLKENLRNPDNLSPRLHGSQKVQLPPLLLTLLTQAASSKCVLRHRQKERHIWRPQILENNHLHVAGGNMLNTLHLWISRWSLVENGSDMPNCHGVMKDTITWPINHDLHLFLSPAILYPHSLLNSSRRWDQQPFLICKLSPR
jgi:hypothetical protein